MVAQVHTLVPVGNLQLVVLHHPDALELYPPVIPIFLPQLPPIQCDRIPANVTFNPNSFTNTTTNPSGVARGIAIQLGDTPDYYTNTGDSDLAQYFPPGIEPSTVYGTKANCGGANSNGAVVVNLGNRPHAIGDRAVDAAAGAYGFVRFRGLVK